jgi:hypothetical protein
LVFRSMISSASSHDAAIKKASRVERLSCKMRTRV